MSEAGQRREVRQRWEREERARLAAYLGEDTAAEFFEMAESRPCLDVVTVVQLMAGAWETGRWHEQCLARARLREEPQRGE